MMKMESPTLIFLVKTSFFLFLTNKWIRLVIAIDDVFVMKSKTGSKTMGLLALTYICTVSETFYGFFFK